MRKRGVRTKKRGGQMERQKHSNTVIAALYLASKLPTCQGCPDENHEVVIMAMDALKILDEMGWPGTKCSFTGSRFTSVLPGVTLGCISEEARDLLDRVMAAWNQHLAELKKSNGEDYEPGHYGFAYWLIRWSGLVAPSDPKGTEKHLAPPIIRNPESSGANK